MIKQFIEELVELEKKYCQDLTYKLPSQKIKDTIKIFYDYCIDTDNDLHIALKYMIENHKRPRYYRLYKKFYWFKKTIDYDEYNWLNPILMDKILFYKNYKYEFIDSYENCLLALQEAL